MCREIENFCEKWMGYLMRPRPPPNLAGASFRLCLVCLGAGLPGQIAGMVQIYLNFARKCSYLLNKYLSLYLHFFVDVDLKFAHYVAVAREQQLERLTI